MAQSTNDAYPTALRLAIIFATAPLVESLRRAGLRLQGQGRGIRRRAEDGPHPAAGRGADDARPGIRRLSRHREGGHRAPAARRRRCFARSISAPPRSAPASTPTRAMRRSPSRSCRAPRGQPMVLAGEPDRGDLRHGRLRAVLRRAEARSRSSCRRSATICACSRRGRAPASAKSACRRCRRARRSCPARSIR